MDVYDLVNNIEIQGQINYCYYDYEKEERVIIDVVDATFREIKYSKTKDISVCISTKTYASREEYRRSSTKNSLTLCKHE